jgi:hypothetical protein
MYFCRKGKFCSLGELSMSDDVASQSAAGAALRILFNPALTGTALRCFASIFRNFFGLQYWGLLSGKIPVSRVDHLLDEKIPFDPSRVEIYMDFSAFWIRCQGFLLRRFGSAAENEVRDFLAAIGKLYAFAAEVYKRNFSTTRRPRYLKDFRFALIHAFDPHLMCIPSLHVMVMILSYTRFRKSISVMQAEKDCAAQCAEIDRGAADITEAVLFVKQHSVNCIAAAMYAMTCFDGELFPPAGAEVFLSALFTGSLPLKDAEAVRGHIKNLYERFLDEGKNTEDWTRPLLNFLASQPPAEKK